MAIQFQCSKCKTALEAPDELAGKVGNCPNCSEQIKVPGES